jgi:SAM-dependent methyltransferase
MNALNSESLSGFKYHLPVQLEQMDGMWLRDELWRELCTDPARFDLVFWKGGMTPYSPSLNALISTGLLTIQGETVTANYQIWHQDGIFVITDRPDYPLWDRVFPVFSDENLLLARLELWKNSKVIADVGTGSGFLAVHAALAGCDVFATDINPRALAMANLNAQLNGVGKKIEFVSGDTFAGSKEHRYDSVISNPPFVPVPQETSFHLAGSGGTHGTAMIEKILAQIPGFCVNQPRLAFTAVSLLRNGISRVHELIQHHFGSGASANIIPIYSESLSLPFHAALFGEGPKVKEWISSLECEGYDSLGYFLVTVGDSGCKDFALPQQKTRFAGDWNRRQARYQLWVNAPQLGGPQIQ